MSDTFQTIVLIIFSPQVKSFIILTYLNINPELLIKMWAEAHPSGYFPPKEVLCYGNESNDSWRGMVSRKSQRF